MAKFCENCGAYITENQKYCLDCGKPTPNCCSNCGELLEVHQKFCPVCGAKRKAEGSKTPIILAAVAIVAVIAILLFASVNFTEMQDVQISGISFSIPANMEEDSMNAANEIQDGVRTKSKLWSDGEDFVEIEVESSKNSKFNAESINDKRGGQKESYMGFDGRFRQLPNSYAFSFVKDNKLCTVYASNPDLFSQIEVSD